MTSALVEAVDGFGESVVVAVANAAHGGLEAGLGETLGVYYRHVLHAPVAVMDEPAAGYGSAIMKRLLQGIENEAGVSRAADPPADNAASIGVDHERHIDEARPGGDICEVRDPEHVRTRRLELAVHPVERAWRGFVADRRPHAPSADDALKTHRLHQPSHGAACHVLPLPHQLTPDLANAIDLEVLIEHAPDLHAEHCIPLDARRRRVRAAPPRVVSVIGGRGDLQLTTDRLDPVSPTMIVDERDHGLNRRSSSAWAK
jgi:hypothetical protein